MEVDVEPIALSVDAAIACGLILGACRIPRRRRHAVSDDGRGLPPGFDFRNSPSPGLQIVNIMVRKLDGTISLGEGEGTSFRIAFPEETDGAIA